MNVPNTHEGTLYPNLYIYWSNVGMHETSFANHAGVTTELFMAALKQREELSFREFIGIRGLTDIPIDILMLPQIVRMERNHYKHRKMIDDLYAYKEEILEGAAAGHDWCKRFVAYHPQNVGADMESLERLHTDFYAGNHVSYTRYLAIKHDVYDCIYFYRASQKKPRDLAPEKKKPKEKFIYHDKVVCDNMIMHATDEQVSLVKQFLIDKGIWNEQYDLNKE